jgi:hypothetical protein
LRPCGVDECGRLDTLCHKEIHQLALATIADRERGGKLESRVGMIALAVGNGYVRPPQQPLPDAAHIQYRDIDQRAVDGVSNA